jgi:hypothetical protein
MPIMNRREEMRTIQNQVKGFAVAALVAVALVNAAPAWADQAITVTRNGSKMCIMLSGVMSNVPEIAAEAIGAVLTAMGCGI